MKASNGLLTFLFAVVVILCLVASFRLISLQSAVILLIFNALFISLTSQLNGAFTRKIFLLASGNIMGLTWNFIFYSFATAGTAFFGKIFNNLYTVFFPFLSALWIISFWSLSLTVLHHESPNLETHF